MTRAAFTFNEELWRLICYKEKQRWEAQAIYATDVRWEMQPHINRRMRFILIDWIYDVVQEAGSSNEAFFLTIRLLDRLLQKASVIQSELQLVGCVCFFLASKMEEVRAPKAKYVIALCEKAYTNQQFLSTEKRLLELFEYNLNAPTTVMYVNHFMEVHRSTHNGRKALLFAEFMAITLLFDSSTLVFPPSQLAAAICLTALHSCNVPLSSVVMSCLYTMQEIFDAVQCIHAFFSTGFEGLVAYFNGIYLCTCFLSLALYMTVYSSYCHY